MSITRRAAVTALAALPLQARGQARRPLVFGHRGASGERPEHTLMAYRLAIAQGADVIEPDLVSTKDGVLVCRHELDLTQTTDIETRKPFLGLQAVRSIAGRDVNGWFADDLTAAQFSQLRAKERMPDLRPGNARYDGREAPPTFQQVIDLAKDESARLGRPIGIAPEMKEPTWLAGKGHDLVEMLLKALDRNGLPSAEVPVFIQCFEPGPLQRLEGRTSAKLVQVVQIPALTSDASLVRIAGYAQVVAPEKALITKGLVDVAHDEGLQVVAWTYRAENAYLPPGDRRGTDRKARGDMAAEIRRHVAMGIDGLFTDYPALAAAALS